ncbi:hypothetical protein [Flavobacterium sp. ZB4P13]|uniref:hypothetical protein n=1 Tax=Flavobacterium sp. ZB4P13 TaxID=3401728 RepID=UPI003AAD345B
MKKATTFFSAITVMIAVLISSPSFGQMKMESKKTVSTVSAATLKTNMRKLWEDHVTWTRNVILCLVDELPGTDQAIKRLLQNQVDIGNAIKPFYGEAAGNKLTKLLKEHIIIAADVVNAAEAGNTVALNKANKKWYANADEISEFLCKANPKWALKDMKMMMNDHLKLTTNEAVQRIKKNYDADVIAYDKVHNEILQMSDMLANGIIKQFPEKFKTGNNMKPSR